ncbi:MarR family winged helix-turn-helix transcriptional regulator [Antrihabitans cavernicola]|uniref:Winged helix-turn-helix transcriptional regulator n=1 Tax=Antrihabitans cavernicola TaxID=2495913 RepID=A0A5A7SFB1_9NOCA|nr:MarR family winged helix-turn-helix transcriptional regulator [Spelaeibacter cavernicola]KAA0024810.1 winged helix-turn-helix transcriptional regulator [Spelaeibacter cavernicola]
MTAHKDLPLTSTVVFRLGTLGTLATARMTDGLDEHELKPKHVGLMSVLESGAATSQLEVAQLMGVAPSLVVALADHLQQRGLITRIRDDTDRRRQNLALTDRGRDVFAACTAIANRLDAALTADLTPAQLRGLADALRSLAHSNGLPS